MIRFRNPKRHEEEFKQLDSRLKIIMFALDGWMQDEFERGEDWGEIEYTHLWRSQAEQDNIYAADEKYKEKPWLSVHQYYRGADASIKNFTEKQCKKIVEWLNNNFAYGEFRQTSLIHDIGHGKHLHLQCNDSDVTKIMKYVK